MAQRYPDPQGSHTPSVLACEPVMVKGSFLSATWLQRLAEHLGLKFLMFS